MDKPPFKGFIYIIVPIRNVAVKYIEKERSL